MHKDEHACRKRAKFVYAIETASISYEKSEPSLKISSGGSPAADVVIKIAAAPDFCATRTFMALLQPPKDTNGMLSGYKK